MIQFKETSPGILDFEEVSSYLKKNTIVQNNFDICTILGDVMYADIIQNQRKGMFPARWYERICQFLTKSQNPESQ